MIHTTQLLVFLAFGLLTAVPSACPICSGQFNRPPSFAESIIASKSLLIARASGEGRFKVEVRLRGAEPKPGTVIELPATLSTRLLVARGEDGKFTSLGPYLDTLRTFLPVALRDRGVEAKTDAQWHDKMQRYRPFLDHTDPRVSSSAWNVWASAPYAALRSCQPRPDRKTLLKWLDDPARAGQRSLYWVLLGVQANDLVRTRIKQEIETAWSTNNTDHLSALLDADLSANGKSAVAWIETHYIDDRNRTLEEIQAALLALRLRGEGNGPADRAEIISVFLRYIEKRRPLSGFVAADLQRWKCWDAQDLFSGILSTGEPVHPSGRLAINKYLESCPSLKSKTEEQAPLDR